MSQRTHEGRVKEVAWQTGWADESGIEGIVEEIIRAYHAELEADGWQVVPKEATDDMIAAALGRPSWSDARVVVRYGTMLAAAPSPLDPNPSQQGQDDSGDQQPLETEMKSGESHARKT